MEKEIPLPKNGEIRDMGSEEQIISVVKETLSYNRQVIIFVNTKRGAESQAEKIAKVLEKNIEGEKLSEQAIKALSSPTKQCRRLSAQLSKGVAFHHAGLASKQREIVEEGFRSRNVKVICATPTLAAGVDLPAFRVIIRDTKRYGGPWGMSNIAVLEYQQMSGRAGRPGKDPWGEALIIAKSEEEAKALTKEYIEGEAEELYSKLAVEPVLRTYILSLTAGGFVKSKTELKEFFSKTMYAHQFGDLEKLYAKLESMICSLRNWKFLTKNEEQEAEENMDIAKEEHLDEELSIYIVGDADIDFGTCSPVSGQIVFFSSDNLSAAAGNCTGGSLPDNFTVMNDGNVHANVTINVSAVGGAHSGSFIYAFIEYDYYRTVKS